MHWQVFSCYWLDQVHTIVDSKLKVIYTACKDGQIKAIKVNDNKFQLLSDIAASSVSIMINNLKKIAIDQLYIAYCEL